MREGIPRGAIPEKDQGGEFPEERFQAGIRTALLHINQLFALQTRRRLPKIPGDGSRQRIRPVPKLSRDAPPHS